MYHKHIQGALNEKRTEAMASVLPIVLIVTVLCFLFVPAPSSAMLGFLTGAARSIMDKAGVHSPAHTVMFSLPVNSVAGLRSIMVAAGEIEE